MLVMKLKRRVRATAYRAGVAGVGVLFLLGAAVFFLAALHIALSDALGAITSALFIGASLLIVGLVLLLIASRAAVRNTVPQNDGSSLLGTGGTKPTITDPGEHRSILRDPTLQAASVGLLAGLLIRKRRRRRR
jgi:protein-S-isoprenylcysteine O-methyltransferase Ste14